MLYDLRSKGEKGAQGHRSIMMWRFISQKKGADRLDTLLYKPSGKFSPINLLVGLLVALVAIPVLSFAYIRVNFYMPSVYLSIFACVGTGVAFGYVICFAMHIGKVRSPFWAVVLSLLLVTVMKYVMWCFYIPLVLTHAYETLSLTLMEEIRLAWAFFRNPQEILTYAQRINEIGVWSVQKIDVKGIALYVVWAAELLVFYISCIVVTKQKARVPFNEIEKRWYKAGKKKLNRNMPEDIVRFKQELLAGQFDGLRAMVDAPYADAQEFCTIAYYAIHEEAEGYVTVQRVKKTKEKRGKEKQEKENIVEYLKVSADVLSALQRVSTQTNQASANA